MPDNLTDATHRDSLPGWRLPLLAPLLVFAVLAAFLAAGLTLNPREIPSPLIGKPVPRFDLPSVKGRSPGLASRDLTGEVSLVNVFASWCVACREEHSVLMELSRQGVVAIHGLNYGSSGNRVGKKSGKNA